MFRNIKFDGNAKSFHPAKPYQFEQSDTIYPVVVNAPGKPGRLNILIENCTFEDSISTDLAFGANTVSMVRNCLFTPDPQAMMKGDCSITSGNTEVHMDNCQGKRIFDIELNNQMTVTIGIPGFIWK